MIVEILNIEQKTDAKPAETKFNLMKISELIDQYG